MKEDAPVPDDIPRRRMALKTVPDLWIATWLARDDIAPSDRKRLEALKAERRAAVPDRPVGVVVGEEGMTPKQLATFKDVIVKSGATEIHHPGVSSSVHGMCKSLGVPVEVHHDVRDFHAGNIEVVKASKFVIAAPKGAAMGGRRKTVWDHVRYAKHRSVPVKVIMPDGSTE
jgi:hypothetical protein